MNFNFFLKSSIESDLTIMWITIAGFLVFFMHAGFTLVEAGFTQAKFNDDASSFVIFEILVIAVAFGIGMQSWWWGGGIFLGGMIVMVTPILNILFCIAMTAAWAVAGFHIGETIDQEGANYVIAILAGLISLGAHLGAIEWAEDMGAKD